MPKRTATKYATSQRKSKLKRIKARSAARRQGGAGLSTAAPRKAKPQLQDYAGDPLKFLGDLFSGGALRK